MTVADASMRTEASPLSADGRERVFYLIMSLLCATVVLAGFGGYILVGISHFSSPWWVHVHGLTFMGWMALYITQNVLIVRGSTAQHRKLGLAMTGWMAWMLVVGPAVLIFNTITHRTPPIFTPAYIIALDLVNLLVFLALAGAGLALRHRPDWHRRLMLAATISVISPGAGRVSNLALHHFSLWACIGILLSLAALAIGFDLYNRRRAHPALLIGFAAIVIMGAATPPVAAFPPLVAWANALAAR